MGENCSGGAKCNFSWGKREEVEDVRKRVIVKREAEKGRDGRK